MECEYVLKNLMPCFERHFQKLSTRHRIHRVHTLSVSPFKDHSKSTADFFGIYESDKVRMSQVPISWDGAFQIGNGFLRAHASAFGRRASELDKVLVIAISYAETDITGVLSVKDLEYLAVLAKK